MRTVKEVAELTGISVRTLHYYDEIGLFHPTEISEAGYRLYDDKALERLQQILFFREFDMPLKDINAIMENPAFDRNQILRSQRKMLEMKKERLEHLIASIDDILKGENKMDFTVFDKEDVAAMYETIVKNMPKEQLEKLAEQYGSLEEYEKHFKEKAESEQAQKNYAKVVEWYGNKEEALAAATSPSDTELYSAYQNRIRAVMRNCRKRRMRSLEQDLRCILRMHWKHFTEGNDCLFSRIFYNGISMKKENCNTLWYSSLFRMYNRIISSNSYSRWRASA